jgi:hypothetical protein
MDDDVPLVSSSIRARRCPGAAAGVWAFQTVFALVASWPAVALVRASYGRSSSGDASLWEPGSLPLLTLLSREANGVRAATGTAGAVLVLGAVTGLVPLAAAMIAMATTRRSGLGIGLGEAVGRAVGVFRPFALLFLTVTLAQGITGAALVFIGQLVEAWSRRSLGEAHAQQLGIAIGAALVPCVVVLGIVHDLARAAVVRLALGPFDALAAGAQVLRAAPLSLTWSWTWRALASLMPVLAVAALADRIGGRGGIALLLLGLLHQSVVLARVAVRGSWLAKALRALDGATPRTRFFADSAGD